MNKPKLTGVALHEAGHILIGGLHGYECDEVWITSAGAGQALVGPEMGQGPVEAEVCISLAGYLAQGLELGDDFLLSQIARARQEVPPDDHFDVLKAFRRLILEAPEAGDTQLMMEYRRLEALTRARLSEADNARELERIAGELLGAG